MAMVLISNMSLLRSVTNVKTTRHWSCCMIVSLGWFAGMTCVVVNALTASSPKVSATVTIREAKLQDVAFARGILLRQAMNPLSIRPEHLLIATTKTTATASANKIDDTLTLRDEIVVGFGQIRPLPDRPRNNNNSNDQRQYSELASLFVLPNYRHQGIATALIQALLQRHDEKTRCNNNSTNKKGVGGRGSRGVVCLLTLRPTIPLYKPWGFMEVPVTIGGSGNSASSDDGTRGHALPPSLQREFVAGSLISAVLGNDLVGMIRE